MDQKVAIQFYSYVIIALQNDREKKLINNAQVELQLTRIGKKIQSFLEAPFYFDIFSQHMTVRHCLRSPYGGGFHSVKIAIIVLESVSRLRPPTDCHHQIFLETNKNVEEYFAETYHSGYNLGQWKTKKRRSNYYNTGSVRVVLCKRTRRFVTAYPIRGTYNVDLLEPHYSDEELRTG